MNRLKPFFLVVDIGFLLYWAITAFALIPATYLFQDYTNPILVAWNWSFLPLDLFVSATGLSSVYFHSRSRIVWRQLALLSLVLTFCSGLQAIAFWAFRCEFDLFWWAPNLFLMIYPLFFLPQFILPSPVLNQPNRKSAQPG